MIRSGTVSLLIFFLSFGSVSAAAISTESIYANSSKDTEIYVGKDGVVSISGAKVMQLAGRSFYTRLYWGDSFVRLLVKTTPTTQIVRGTGEATTYTEIAVNDYLNLEGKLESASESLVLVATRVKNVSVQKEQSKFSGTVSRVDVGGNSFSLTTKEQGAITVAVSGNTSFVKGSRAIDLSRLSVGDKVTEITGEFNYTTKTLSAVRVVVYIDTKLYTWQNFEGKLVATPGDKPSSLQVSVGGVGFTVNIPSDIIVWNKNKGVTSFARFVAGDTIRFHGKRQEADAPIIDADIVRNMNL